MLKSMTAYGRGSKQASCGRFSVEIQSLNRKFLDIMLTLPKELSCFDVEVRKWVSAVVFRGQVTIKIFASFDSMSPLQVSPNIPLVRQIQAAAQKIAKELNFSASQPLSMELLLSQKDVLCYHEDLQSEELCRSALREAVNQALEQLMKMKTAEGEALQRDITGRILHAEDLVKAIAAKSENSTNRYRQKLQERLEELLPGAVENEERILREVCVYADKVDSAEEVTRFYSHCSQFHKLMTSKETAVGKTLEFILQELSREINTIGSKSSDVEVSSLVIQVKAELERIREQIQNIE
jgi:uncharacterized protein (TIGR00255 family)